MPNKRRSTTHRAAPKLFRCTGYGNCDMVFTRSEHLARHERKHTGEKPYKCVVSGCGRMFSRFDNMMQHTQTHEKNRKPVATPAKEVTSVVHGHRVHAPSLTPIKTESWPEEANHTIPDLEMATSMVDSRTLPPPTRRSSFSSFGGHMRYPPTSSHPSNVNYQSSYPSSNLPPTSYYQYNEYQNVNNVPRNRASWPIKRDAYHSHSNHPHYPTYLSLSNHFNDSRANDFYYDSQRRSSISTASSDSNLTSPVSLNFPQEPVVVRRRISIDDLRLPIENFRNIQLEEDGYHQHYVNPTKSETVDITPDEYEALQGFSKFHSKPVVAREESPYSSDSTTPSPILRNNSPIIAAQVCAMRQRVMAQNESFQRG